MQVNGGSTSRSTSRSTPDILGSDGMAATPLLGEVGTVDEVGGRVPATPGCRRAPPPSMAQTMLEQPVWSPVPADHRSPGTALALACGLSAQRRHTQGTLCVNCDDP